MLTIIEEQIETTLIEISQELGLLHEMNGPATASLATYFNRVIPGRAIESLTVAELRAHIALWRDERAAFYRGLAA